MLEEVAAEIREALRVLQPVAEVRDPVVLHIHRTHLLKLEVVVVVQPILKRMTGGDMEDRGLSFLDILLPVEQPRPPPHSQQTKTFCECQIQ
jgi:hypothetical protein